MSAAPLMVAAVMFWRLLRRDLDEMLQRIVLRGKFDPSLPLAFKIAKLFDRSIEKIFDGGA